MPEQEKPFDIRQYLEIALRRKWYIVIPLVCSMAISFGVYKYLPKVYQATTLILVQPQRVPENYVRATITDSVINRLNTISQEILSRTRLEKVIEELNLYGELRHKQPMEGIVERTRKAIVVKVQDNPRNERARNSFSISYQGTDPRTVMMVTNKLASLFIEENLKVRELQAEGTSEFLSKELSAMEEQLKSKEQGVRNFKERNMGQLPQQLDANLRILDRLQQQLQTTSENTRAAEDRMIIIQNQIDSLKKRESSLVIRDARGNLVSSPRAPAGGQFPEDPVITQWNNLKRELTNAQSKYTESHPDVIDLKRKIASLEPRVNELMEKQKAQVEEEAKESRGRGPLDPSTIRAADPLTERQLAQYTEQYNEVLLEIRRLKNEAKNLKEQIDLYQRRIEDIPKREQELAIVTRDYDLLKQNYQSLLDKKIQAQMAENLERKQQGEQFKILDPARLPEKPFKPDRNKILMIGAMLGLMAGLGLTWFRESLDRSFHSISDVEVYLAIPVIATIPNLEEEKHLSSRRKAHRARR